MATGNIIITGFMGTGKSVVGYLLAKRLGLAFVDMDAAIEARLSMSIGEIFTNYGEKFFRQQEHILLAELSSSNNTVIATGGGALLSEENRALLSEETFVVCLTCEPEEIVRRLADDNDRPLLATPDRLQRIRAILVRRKPLYDLIPCQLDTTGLTIDEVVARLEELYRSTDC